MSGRDFPRYPADGRMLPTGVPSLSSRATSEQREAARRREAEYIERAAQLQREQRERVLARKGLGG